MKYAVLLFGLLLASAAFAQGDGDEAALKCVKSCCTSNGGTWDTYAETCDIESGSPQEDRYAECAVNCLLGGGGGCCGPALILFGIAAVAALRR